MLKPVLSYIRINLKILQRMKCLNKNTTNEMKSINQEGSK